MADDENTQIQPEEAPETPVEQSRSPATTAAAPPLSQEAYDSFVSRTGVPLSPADTKTLLPLLQKRKAQMIQEDLAGDASPQTKAISKLDIFLHGYSDAMRNAQMKQQADEQSKLNRWKLFTQDAAQFAGVDPGTAVKFQKVERDAAEKARKNDIIEQYHAAAQKTRDALAAGRIDFWNKQGKHLENQDAETATHHQALEAQAKWTRESINSLEQDKLKLQQYREHIYSGKADAAIKQKAQQLQNEMSMKLMGINAGIQKFNIARQFELSKIDRKTGKPLYMDKEGNIPAYTPVPEIAVPSPGAPEPEVSPLEPFPETPQLTAAPPPPVAMRAPQGVFAPPQRQPLLAGAVMPGRQAPGSPPPPAPAQLQSGQVPPPHTLGKPPAVTKPPDVRAQARVAYDALVASGMTGHAAATKVREQFPGL